MAKNTMEQWFGPQLRGPITAKPTNDRRDPFAGETTILSGTATVVVSTNLVNSASVVLATVNAATAIASLQPVVVNSIVTGVSFNVSRAPATNSPIDTRVSWFLVNPKE